MAMESVADALIKALASREAPIDRVLFDRPAAGATRALQRYPSDPFRALAKALEGRSLVPDHPYWSDAAPCSMHIEEVEAIWSAIATSDDWQPFEDKVRAIPANGRGDGAGCSRLRKNLRARPQVPAP